MTNGSLAIRRTMGPSWFIPLIVLIGASLIFTASVYKLSGGREIADDAGSLIRLAKAPFALWGDYKAAGFSDKWGSFPPLMPLVFGSLVLPWVRAAGEFWGFRLGILSWSVVALIALYIVLRTEKGITEGRRRLALILFAILPSVLAAIAFIPQEEIYVSLFCLALYAAARAGRWRLVLPLLILAAFAGKWFLLSLAAPLALLSPAPLRNLLTWGACLIVLVGAYIWYHQALFGLTPILSHLIDPGGSISIWALIWNLGYRIDPALVKSLSLLLVATSVMVFSWAGRRSGVGLVFLLAGSLYLTLLGLSITFPAYVLWNVPFVLICVSLMRERRRVAAMIVLLFAWGVGEWGANFFRGVKLAMDTARPEGKSAIAAFAERTLGHGFPYHAAHIACIILVLASGIAQIIVLWNAGRGREPAPSLE